MLPISYALCSPIRALIYNMFATTNTSLPRPSQDRNLTRKCFYPARLCGFVDHKFSANSFISAQCAADITSS